MDFSSSVPFDHIITWANWVLEDTDPSGSNGTSSGDSSGGAGGNAAVAKGLKGLRMLKLAKFLTLLKLLRITRLLKYASQWEEVGDFTHNKQLKSMSQAEKFAFFRLYFSF